MRVNYDGSDQNTENKGWFNDNISSSKKQTDFNDEKVVTPTFSSVVTPEINYYTMQLEQTYKDIYNELYLQSLNNYEDNFDVDVSKEAPNKVVENKPTKQEEKKEKKSKKGLIIGIISGSVALIGIILFIVFFFFNPLNNGKLSKEDIQAQIDVMYTDNLKKDIREGYKVSDLEKIRDEIDVSPDKDNCLDVLNELDNIELFLEDVEQLKIYQDENYNIEPEEVGNVYNEMVTGISNYTQTGLQSTIKDRVITLYNEREDYLKLKNELTNITDYMLFSDEVYQQRINRIKHTPNKEELQSLLDSAKSEKAVLQAEEKVKNSTDKKEKENAEKELKSAKKKQKESEEKLELVKDLLIDTLKEKNTTTQEVTTVETTPTTQPTSKIDFPLLEQEGE